MQEIQGNMYDMLLETISGTMNKWYFQLQNRYLAFKEQLNRRTRVEEIISAVPDLQVPYKYSMGEEDEY